MVARAGRLLALTSLVALPACSGGSTPLDQETADAPPRTHRSVRAEEDTTMRVLDRYREHAGCLADDSSLGAWSVHATEGDS